MVIVSYLSIVIKNYVDENGNCVPYISETELFQKIDDGVSKKNVWQKPLLLLTKDGENYNYISDKMNETYHLYNVNGDSMTLTFVRVGGRLEVSLNGVIIDHHHPDVDLYENLGGPLAYDEKIHRYFVNLVEYEAKPVVCLICVADKNCSVADIPEWMKEEFEIAMLKLAH